MAGINKVILVARLGKDPEMKYMQNGNAICNFSAATSEAWTDKTSGEKKEVTEWHRIVAFGKLAEICGKYLAKGALIYAEGKLKSRSWEQDGITKYATDIVIDVMQMLGSKSDGQGQPTGHMPPVASSQPFAPMESDDVPF